MTLGEKIHALRVEHDMTMEDLAKKVGVQRSAINKYEKGIVVNLKRSTLASLCKVFNVPSSYLLDDDDFRLDEEERRLVTAYRGATNEIRSAALTMLENSAAENTPKKDSSADQMA